MHIHCGEAWDTTTEPPQFCVPAAFAVVTPTGHHAVPSTGWEANGKAIFCLRTLYSGDPLSDTEF